MSMLRCAFHGLIIAALQLAGFAVAAETSGARCSGAEYGQFDFWLGTWSVTNQGKVAGSNRIEKVLDGCALLETWRSSGNHRGHSLTFYDSARAIWHQTWSDVGGEPLYLEGRFEDGRMRLEGTRPAGNEGVSILHRIEWTPLSDGRVRQHWRASEDAGRTWAEVFDGYYTKSP
ncbi:MAG: hypothetical protein ACT4O5_10020 [Gammaproteobacteria bacterium]